MIDPHAPRYSEAFSRLLSVMNDLREKCPWDRKQTLESLRYLTIEEVHELSEAILQQDFDEIKKELGDVLLHLVFYSKIADEKGAFDIADVINALCEKLIARHPHVYGAEANQTASESSADEIRANWEKIKAAEKAQAQQAGAPLPSVLDGVPISLPNLVKAMRIQEKARGVGFDWEKIEQVWEKVQEELAEFSQHCTPEGTPTELVAAEEEFGDLLFALVNYARFAGINPENALAKTNQKFTYRFQYIERKADQEGRSISQLSLEEMNRFWEEAKNEPQAR
ncbi:nucleoside triphosphate pyrophosphohydrolase [Hugenholtzia roseola]|uniref:nucleoside triphosphate pyrophosphohydrolase n=1 Tax=Hugenholtzia roseola TaxID=1002 RepID=UPI00047BAAE5|nr:nucleoside triphosphate pyrophosphohydrolase [Hugenholtzia roseola]